MRLTIEVHHTITLDPKLFQLLSVLFPNQAQLDALAKDITDKTSTLQTAVDTNETT